MKFGIRMKKSFVWKINSLFNVLQDSNLSRRIGVIYFYWVLHCSAKIARSIMQSRCLHLSTFHLLGTTFLMHPSSILHTAHAVGLWESISSGAVSFTDRKWNFLGMRLTIQGKSVIRELRTCRNATRAKNRYFTGTVIWWNLYTKKFT